MLEEKSVENTNLDYLKDRVVPNKDKQKNTDISDAGVRFLNITVLLQSIIYDRRTDIYQKIFKIG